VTRAARWILFITNEIQKDKKLSHCRFTRRR
jgi:hypothetical protein